jgi:hypothetical protein
VDFEVEAEMVFEYGLERVIHLKNEPHGHHLLPLVH